MKLRPILFSTPMVQALLEGRKTQTRRVLKMKGCKSFMPPPDWGKDAVQHWTKGYYPYGKIGDVLWVRETFNTVLDRETKEFLRYGFKATDTFVKAVWKPSIHMPFEAARIFLEITDVRVERLQDISNDDAIAEGIAEQDHELLPKGWKDYMDDHIGVPFTSPKGSFKSLWKSINGLDSWDANPWVWVIEFKRINKPTVCNK